MKLNRRPTGISSRAYRGFQKQLHVLYTLLRWQKVDSGGHQTAEDYTWLGQSSTPRNEKIWKENGQIFQKYTQLSTRVVVEAADTDKAIVWKILREGLDTVEVWDMAVPQCLTPKGVRTNFGGKNICTDTMKHLFCKLLMTKPGHFGMILNQHFRDTLESFDAVK